MRRRGGYLVGNTPFYHEMRTDHFLVFVAQAHGDSDEKPKVGLRRVTEAWGPR